jgi:prevent-host-death family protein
MILTMAQISATHLARHMSEILDGVEHRGESYTVVRHGRPVAKLEAAARPSLRALAEAIEREPLLDDDFERDVRDGLSILSTDVRDPWNA